MQRKLKEKSTRKIFKSGNSYAITLPVELMNELKWQEKQKVVVKKRGRGILIVDWKKIAKI